MKRLTFFIPVLFTLMSVFPLSTKAQTHNLSKEELVAFKEDVGQMIDRFQNLLSILGSKDQSKIVKETYKKQTLKLFMGEGKPYTDKYGNEKRAVHMQVSSLTQATRNIPMKEYLDRLVGLPYAKVQITQAETYHLGELKQVGEHYETTATVFQKFCGWNADGRKVYCDTTAKYIRIYLIPDEDFYGKKWIVKFGDVDVLETTE